EEHGEVSEPTALAMAEGVAHLLGADVAAAVTGSAGPEPLEVAAGTMIVAVRTPEQARAQTLRLPGDRERVRTYASTSALHLLRLAVLGEWWGR
ncbi:MAG: CinA family protein, partial [Acidimicrobiia bacterium]